MVSSPSMIGQSSDPAEPALPAIPVGEGAANPAGAASAEPPRPDPTRYGDWEKNGRCIDF